MAGLNLNRAFERIVEPELHTAAEVWIIQYIGVAGEKPERHQPSQRRLDNGGIAWNVAEMRDGYWNTVHLGPGQIAGKHGRKTWFEVRGGRIVRVWKSQPSVVTRVYDAQNERIHRELAGQGGVR
jgi:hypothetical protein